jgi:flagellar biosynthesis protein FlhA
MAKNIQPILLASPTLRRHLKQLVEQFIPSLIVLSQSELLSDIRFQSIGEVNSGYAG